MLNLQDNILLPVKHKQPLPAAQPVQPVQHGQNHIPLGKEVNEIGQDCLFPALMELCLLAFLMDCLRVSRNDIKETQFAQWWF